MTKETLLMQYQSECLSALKSTANIHKPFEKTFMDAMKLFMAIPDRINFLQLGRYGRFRNRPTVTFLRMRPSTGLRSTILSSASISQVEEKPSPSILPISPNQARRHLGLVTSGQAVQGIINEDWKSWASVSLTSTTMIAWL